MIAYHGSEKLRAGLLTRVRNHMLADEIIQGVHWEHGKGSHIGCAVHGNDPVELEEQAGIPVILSRLGEVVFENLPNAEAKSFPLEFYEAITEGADLSLTWPKIAVWLMDDEAQGLKNLPARVKKCRLRVKRLYERVIAGDRPTNDEFCDAAWAATAAGAASFWQEFRLRLITTLKEAPVRIPAEVSPPPDPAAG